MKIQPTTSKRSFVAISPIKLMKNQLRNITAGIAIALAGSMSQSHSAPTITTFTGGDAGEGFTLSGTYAYTVDLGAEFEWLPNQTVQGHTFVKASAVGVTVALGGSGNLAAPWWDTTPEYGSFDDDNALEQIMGNTLLSYGTSPSISLTIPVTVGQQYSLQLLFADLSETATRNFDVTIEGNLEVDNFQPQQGLAPATPHYFGTVLTHTFTAGDNELNVLLSQGDWGIGDANPIIQGFTLQAIAGPATVPYVDWASANGVAGTADADSDNDGVDNGVEYFMGITSADPVFTANPALDSTNTITWPMSPTYDGNYEVETSTNLGTWTPVVPKPTPTGGSLIYTLPSGAPGGKNFVRLLVTPN
jgi:Malectin domain